jgi:hypothetical protein
MTLTQTGATVTGDATQTGSCLDGSNGQLSDASGAFTVGNSELHGSSLDFELDQCEFTGTIQGQNPLRATGTVNCGPAPSLTGTWQAERGGDGAPPGPIGNVSGPNGDTLVVADEAVILAGATDDRALAWVGYRLGPPIDAADSAPATGTLDDEVFHLQLSGAAAGQSTLIIFARDSAGNLAQSAFDPVTVLDQTRRPTDLVVGLNPHVSTTSALADMAMDTTRRILFLAQRDSGWIEFNSLDGALSSPGIIPTPYPPTGLDLTPDGSTLVLGFNTPGLGETTFGAVDLTGGNFTLDTTHFELASQIPPFDLGGVNHLVVVSSGRVFAALNTGTVLEYDPGTVSGQFRQDLGPVPNEATVTTSGDRATMLVYLEGSCCPFLASVYRVAGDAFSPPAPTLNTIEFFASTTADLTGSRFLIGNQFFDGTLTSLGPVPASDAIGSQTALSPDGTFAYFLTGYGYQKVRVSDGVTVERVRLLELPLALKIAPDGSRLVLSAVDRHSPGVPDRIVVVDPR